MSVSAGYKRAGTIPSKNSLEILRGRNSSKHSRGVEKWILFVVDSDHLFEYFHVDVGDKQDEVDIEPRSVESVGGKSVCISTTSHFRYKLQTFTYRSTINYSYLLIHCLLTPDPASLVWLTLDGATPLQDRFHKHTTDIYSLPTRFEHIRP
jgi:hypothetical protein